MNKIIKILLASALLVILVFGVYVYNLHALALEGNKIFEYRCQTVNPILIGYKNSFIKIADGLKNPGKYSKDEFLSFYNDYLDGAKRYVPEETKWLAMQKELLERWDFQLLEPWYMKKAGEYEWKMYEGYRDDAQGIVDISNAGGSNPELEEKLQQAKDRRNDNSQLYYDLTIEVSKMNDIRKLFGRVPLPNCEEKNLSIPDTTGILDATPTPASVPASDGFPAS